MKKIKGNEEYKETKETRNQGNERKLKYPCSTTFGIDPYRWSLIGFRLIQKNLTSVI